MDAETLEHMRPENLIHTRVRYMLADARDGMKITDYQIDLVIEATLAVLAVTKEDISQTLNAVSDKLAFKKLEHQGMCHRTCTCGVGYGHYWKWEDDPTHPGGRKYVMLREIER